MIQQVQLAQLMLWRISTTLIMKDINLKADKSALLLFYPALKRRGYQALSFSRILTSS